MSDKSYVTLAQRRCIVCGKDFDTGELLLDNRLRKTFEHHTLVGNGLCPEHKKLHEDGFVAFIAIDNERSSTLANGRVDPSDAYRTGKIAHLRRTVARQMFDGEKFADDMPVVFCDDELIARFEAMAAEVEGGDGT